MLYMIFLDVVGLPRFTKNSSELDAVRTAWASFGQRLQHQLQRFLHFDAQGSGDSIDSFEMIPAGSTWIFEASKAHHMSWFSSPCKRICVVVNRE